MSNYMAIATVTGTLQSILGDAAKVVSGGHVSIRRPDLSASSPRDAGINVFLYQVMPNVAYRNADLPTRRTDGKLVQRPQEALVLRYLLSFFGEDATLESHLLLGATGRQLHAQPALTKPQIEFIVSKKPELSGSNLAEQFDLIRFTPLSLSLEDMSKLWSTFFQVPYVLSVAYEASAVLIETDETPLQPLPVKTRNLQGIPFRQPQIDGISANAVDADEIFFDSVLLIRGKQLKGDKTLILLGGKELVPQSVTDTLITLPLPTGLPVGVLGIQVVQKLSMGMPPVAHHGFESNVSTLILRPRIKLLPTSPVPMTIPEPGGAIPGLKLDVDVTIGKDQRVVVLLNSTPSGNSLAYSIVRPAHLFDSAHPSSIIVPTPKVVAGEYFVRVQIDGAASPLKLDAPAAKDNGPKVTMP